MRDAVISPGGEKSMSSELGIKCQSVSGIEEAWGAPKACPMAPHVLWCDEKPGVRVPASCGSYRCLICGPRKVAERVRVMVWAVAQMEWTRLLTMTLLPDDWQKARAQIRDYRRRLIKKKYQIEWAWAIERNPKKTGYHAHAVQWGTWIDRKDLEKLWGGRFVHITPIKADSADYIAKCRFVCAYGVKEWEQHLAINGNRPVHFSRNYLHGKTSREVLQLMSAGHVWYVADATREEILKGVEYASKICREDSLGSLPELWANGNCTKRGADGLPLLPENLQADPAGAKDREKAKRGARCNQRINEIIIKQKQTGKFPQS